ncbi:MAG: S1/P1 nuclease [Xanthomonadales bacterium]|nr:S1/P1 nuclease [Xanthomonadales bacterium]
MKTHSLMVIVVVTLMCCSSSALAWGPIGHKVVGGLALDGLDAQAERRLHDLMGTSDLEELTDWCNWPDEYRATDQGAWSSPLHYVNIPVGAGSYDAARDCRQELCVTEAIPRYAAELSDPTLDKAQRQRAFGFVCHFVGDLSQALHAGFGHDRGGNDFLIRFEGKDLNLHEFWDSTLIRTRTHQWRQLYQMLRPAEPVPDPRDWDPSLAIQWTNSSHHLASTLAYPAQPEVSSEFEERSWRLIQQQLLAGGKNLSLVLNSAFGSRCQNAHQHRGEAGITDPGQP